MRRFLGALAVLVVLPLSGDTLTYDNAMLRPLTLARHGDRLTISDSHSHAILASAPAATTERVLVRGAEGEQDDVLTIDLAEAFTLRGGIDYDGGACGFDVLELRGGSAKTQHVTQLTPHDGIIDVDGLVIRYFNLEPITDTAPAATYVINGTAGADTVTVTDGPGGTTTVSSPTFESVTFANKTNVVFDGLGGNDTITFNNPTPATGLTSFIVRNVALVGQTGPINYPSLGVAATANVTLNMFNNDVNNVEISTTGASALFSDFDGFTVGGVDAALTGINALGAISLASFDSEGIVVQEPLTANADIALRTSRLAIGATTITTPSVVFIETLGPVANIDLGSTTDVATALEVSDAEIDRILAPTLSFQTFLGVITVSQPISFAGHLILRSPNWFTASGSGSLSAPTLTFEYTFGTPRTWTITPTTIQVTGGAPIPYSGVTTLNVHTSVPMALWTGPGPDTFVVTPSATTTINIDANEPSPPDPGDLIDFELAGVVAPVLTVTVGPTGYSGSLTSANRQPVNFQDIERFIDAPVDLQITKSDGAMTDVAGTTLTYTVQVTNPGPLPVGGVNVSDTFPPQLTGVTWTCSGTGGSTCSVAAGTNGIGDIANLQPGGTVTYVATGTIAPGFTGTLTNTATVTTPSGWTETNPANNTATDTTDVTAQADLIVTKTGPSGSTFAGGDLTYTITLRNAGPSTAQTVTLTDVIPTNTRFVSLTAAPGYTCTTPAVNGTGTVTCTVAALVPSTTADTFTLNVRVDRPLAAGTTITNTATATTTTPDAAGGNNSATAPAITVAEVNIPTLSEWMLLLLAAMLAVVAVKVRT